MWELHTLGGYVLLVIVSLVFGSGQVSASGTCSSIVCGKRNLPPEQLSALNARTYRFVFCSGTHCPPGTLPGHQDEIPTE